MLYDGGHIYPGLYEGWYSVSDEAFLTPDDVMEKINSDGRKMMVGYIYPLAWFPATLGI